MSEVATKTRKRIGEMKSLRIANAVYRALVKTKEDHLLTFEELQGVVNAAMSDIEAEFIPEEPQEPPAAS